MRRLSPAALLLAALTALPVPAARAKDAESTADRLLLADGQTMTGDFLGFTAGQGLQFRHPACAGDLTVKADHLDTLFPRPSPARPQAPAADWRVSLHNGDALIGKLVGYSTDKLVLDTPFAGRLEIASAAVAALAPLAAPDAPGALASLGKAEDWMTPPAAQAFALVLGAGGLAKRPASAAPTIKDGKLLVPSAGAMRTLGMKPQSRLDLTLEGPPGFSVELASEPEADGTESAYAFQVYPRHVGVHRITRGPGSMRSQSCGVFPRAAAKPGPTALSFFSDAKGGRITVVADGEKIGSVALPVTTAAKRLVLRAHRGDLRLARLRLTPGATFPEAGPETRAAADVAALANGDKAEGTLLAITDGKVSFKTDAGTMDLPMARLRDITLSAAHNLAQAADKDAVRVHFGNGCRLTVKAARIKEGVLSGSAAGFGDVAIKVGDAEKIVFNPEARMPSREARADAGQEDAAHAPDPFQGGFIQGGDIQVFEAAGVLQARPDVPLPQGIPDEHRRMLERLLKDQDARLRAPQGQGDPQEEKEKDAPTPANPPEKKDALPPSQLL